MNTINSTNNSQTKFPFSDAELLENINKDNAHANEIASPISSEAHNLILQMHMSIFKN